jgi:hypothetical protein
MTTTASATSVRLVGLGRYVKTPSYSLAVETKSLFTVTGLVLLTSLVGVVDTAITVANTVKLQANPTTGTTGDLCSATDIGTTDTPAGDLLGLPAAPGSALLFGIGTVRALVGAPIFINAGAIEQVTATGADGAVTWHLTFVPITADGNVVSAF